MATQKITLDINQPKSSVSANVQQYDVATRTLVVELTEDGIPYVPEEGATALLEYVKPDNTKELEEYNISGNTIVIEMTEQMMCVPGICFGRSDLTDLKPTKLFIDRNDFIGNPLLLENVLQLPYELNDFVIKSIILSSGNVSNPTYTGYCVSPLIPIVGGKTYPP